MTSNPVSRRNFLKQAAIAATGGYVAATGCNGNKGAPFTERADNSWQRPGNTQDPKSIAEIFKDVPLTDQYGKPIDIAAMFQDKPCVVAFGYDGCPMCQVITPSMRAVQQEAEKRDMALPIVVISVQPEDDRQRMASYVTKYALQGLKQYPGETLPDSNNERAFHGRKIYTELEKEPQHARILHVVCPPTAEAARTLQVRLAEATNMPSSHTNDSDDRQHSPYLTAFRDGRVQKPVRAVPVTASELEARRPSDSFMRTVARDVCNQAEGLQRTNGTSP